MTDGPRQLGDQAGTETETLLNKGNDFISHSGNASCSALGWWAVRARLGSRAAGGVGRDDLRAWILITLSPQVVQATSIGVTVGCAEVLTNPCKSSSGAWISMRRYWRAS
jgi:hypothetical protein